MDFATVGQQRVYAWFAKPLEPARHGYATLTIHMHGEPVDLKNSQYLGRSTDNNSLYLNAKHSDGRTGITKDWVEDDKAPRVDSYFDVLNFAAKVSCPVLMCAGLTDTVSSPTSVYAVYQTVRGQKEIMTCPNIGHAWSPAFDRYAWNWLARIMALE
ncbi:MAG: acetylxylan esterase [bacterium]